MLKFLSLFMLMGTLQAGLCRYHIESTERALDIPTNMLAAIGQVESGKYSKYHKRVEAWPWTVYARGRGQFFQTKTQAERYIAMLIAEGEENIDIGCMQLNWRHHHKHFKSIGEMLHPRHNVQYAGKLLVHHYKSTQDWKKACGNYHSKTPTHHEKYRARLEIAHNDLDTRKKQRPKQPPRFNRAHPATDPSQPPKFFPLPRGSRSGRWLR